ncbi:MAG: kelch repeat-containing protein [Phormidesmis sp.]
MLLISDATALEQDGYLVFDASLSEALPVGQSLTVALKAEGITAKEGPSKGFKGKSRKPFDFADKEFEFSLDDGKTWQAAEKGNQVTFGFGLTYLKVRLPVNDDKVDEGKTPETLRLSIDKVIRGEIDNVKDTGIGSIVDNDGQLPVNVVISDAVVTEGKDKYAVFDVGLSAFRGQSVSLQLEALGKTAQKGAKSEFKDDLKALKKALDKDEFKLLRKDLKGQMKDLKKGKDLEGFKDTLSKQERKAIEKGISKNRVDFAGQEFEVSKDKGKTWKPAKNGRVEISKGTVNSTQVRVAINDDGGSEAPETFELRVARVVQGNVDSITDVGTAVILDNTTALAAAVFDQTFQAEDATLSGPIVLTGRDSEGTGYVDYQNPSGDFIEWTINAPNAGSYELSWRYQNGSGNRPLALQVNSNAINPSFDFPSTGGWTGNDWDFASEVVNLKAGNNTVRLTATGKSGANFDSMRVVATGVDVFISDAAATEGTDNYLIFDVSLAAPSSETITLDLTAIDGTARGGLEADFGIDPAGDPIDYADQEFEVSADGGVTWQDATNGTEVTFAAGETNLKVRLAVHDDMAAEGNVAETMQLAVSSILAGTVRDATDRGDGLITDDEAPEPGKPPISLLPAPDIRVEGDAVFLFDGQDGGLLDRDVDGIGFTMVDPSSNPGNPNPEGGVVGYWKEKLDVTNGVLQIAATEGLQFRNINSQDNMLGIGLNLPSKDLKLETTLVNLPTAAGGYTQAGLWFGQATEGGAGSSENNYIKLVVISPNPGNYQLQALMEEAGTITKTVNIDIPDDPASLDLQLFLDPATRAVSAFYSVSEGPVQSLTVFENVPDEWFSFDQAALDPTIATGSFGGVFASTRNASNEQVFSFDDFSATNTAPPLEPLTSTFDRWTLPVTNPTAMDVGPDGRLYVATLFGNIYAFDIDPQTRTFEQELITTIPDKEGGSRLTLGIAVDPDSTADNVILWVGHSNGSVSDGEANSAKVSRLSGAGFSQKEDVVTGLPRAIANHALNNIDFAPDGNLYLWMGGNTGAGAPNDEPTEFGDRAEQVFSAAVLKVDIQHYKGLDPSKPFPFDGDASSRLAEVDGQGTVIPGEFIDEFYDRKQQELGRKYTEIEVFASGLRNTYDGVFHSNGQIYAPDNGLGVKGTAPPVPRLGDPSDRSITTLFGELSEDNPGVQIDPLNRIVEGGYYGHPNPYRDEVVFKDGSAQGFDNTDADPSNDIPAGHPDYIPPFLNLGKNKSADGIIEYTADNLFGSLKGDLLITSFSTGDDVSRVKLSPDGLTPLNYDTDFLEGFIDPLPIAMGPNGTDLEGIFFVGEFNGGSVTVLESLGVWRNDLPDLPNALGVLDAGSAVIGDQLYMVGGKTNNGPISNVYVYTPGDPIDASDDVWTTLPSTLPGAAVENPAVTAFDGKLYTFGGSTGPFNGARDSAAVYDPATGSWTALPDMPTARGGAQAAVLEGKIYVVGGLGSDGASLNTVEAFDPLTGTWLSGAADPAELQTQRDNPGIAVVDDLLYVFGGRTRDANGTTVDGALNTMEIYDPWADEWTFGAAMPNGRRTMAVGNLNGRIQVIGGEGAPSLDIHEEYNPATGTWRTLPSMATPRHGAAFGTINDVIYVAGGGPTPGSAFTDATEAFDF